MNNLKAYKSIKELFDKIKGNILNKFDIPLPIIRFYLRNHFYFEDEYIVTIGGDEIISIFEYFFTVQEFHFFRNGDVLIQFQGSLDDIQMELLDFLIEEIGFEKFYLNEDCLILKRIINGRSR